MAAEARARQDKYNTIAFTLPISCQVCLGKVKDPVLCPNNHVFCSQCLEVWLQRNQQCPACRVDINPGNPIKKIVGALNEIGDDREKMSNPQLRKARFDILYREYEDEFERLSSEIKLLRTENDVLKQELNKHKLSTDGKSGILSSSKTQETDGLLLLTKKLQDAQRLYEKVKTELAKVREENNSLKDENINLNRENQKLRAEIANRSPQRYGRYTVSTLETKIKSYEKEVAQLNKALEKSDKYIEDLQTEVEDMKKGKKSSTDSLSTESYRTSQYISSKYDFPDNPSKRQLFNGDGSESEKKGDRKGQTNGESRRYGDYTDEHIYSSLHDANKSNNANAKGKKRVTFDLPRNTTTSFDLEMPSPMTSKLSNGSAESPIKGVLKGGKKAGDHSETADSFSFSKPSLLEESFSESHEDRYKPLRSKTDDIELFKPSVRADYKSDSNYYASRSSPTKAMEDSFGLERPSSPWRTKESRSDHDMDETQAIQTELDELDISVTPDFTDCMKILNRAEKKVQGQPESMDFKSSKDYLAEYRSKIDTGLAGKDTNLKVEGKYSADNYQIRSEGGYSSKYYPLGEDFKSGSVLNKEDFKYNSGELGGFDSGKSGKPPSGQTYKLQGGTGDAKTGRYTSSSNFSTDKYSVGSYTKSSDSGPTNFKSASITDLPLSKSTGGYSAAPTASNRLSYSGRPLGQSGFGRSPSLDNLYISPRSNQNTSGSKFATAEDIPGTGAYKSTRYSLPAYDSNLGSSKYSTGENARQGPSSRSSIDNDFLSSRYKLPPTGAAQPSSYIPASLIGASTSSTFTSSSSLPSSVTTTSSFGTSMAPPSYTSSLPMSSYPGTSGSEFSSSNKGGGYSYHSNNSSYGDFSKSDSYLPEPKKRLFESSEDFDVSLSPIKATRKM